MLRYNEGARLTTRHGRAGQTKTAKQTDPDWNKKSMRIQVFSPIVTFLSLGRGGRGGGREKKKNVRTKLVKHTHTVPDHTR